MGEENRMLNRPNKPNKLDKRNKLNKPDRPEGLTMAGFRRKGGKMLNKDLKGFGALFLMALLVGSSLAATSKKTREIKAGKSIFSSLRDGSQHVNKLCELEREPLSDRGDYSTYKSIRSTTHKQTSFLENKLYFKTEEVKLSVGIDATFAQKLMELTTTRPDERYYFLIQCTPEYLYDLDGFNNSLRNLAVSLVDYIPNNGFFVSAPLKNIEKVAMYPYIQSVSEIKPEWKFSPRLHEIMKEAPDRDHAVWVVAFERCAELEQQDFKRVDSASAFIVYEGKANLSKVEELLEINKVRWAESKPIERMLLSESNSCISSDDIHGSVTGDGVEIGIIDSGIDFGHPHFDFGRVIAARDWVDGGLPQDDFGHGTHVAGIVAGESSHNGHLLSGVSPDATLIVERVFDAGGIWRAGGYTDVYDEVVSRGAEVVNCSWGHNSGREYDSGARITDEYALNHPDVLFNFANGNYPDDSNCISPALAKNVIAVGAVVDGSRSLPDDSVDATSSYRIDLISSLDSLRLPRDNRIKPDVTAPGEWITSSTPASSYQTWRGTSMATPHCTGLSALLRDFYPALPSGFQSSILKAFITGNTIDVSNKSGQTSYYLSGWGKIDAQDALYWNSWEQSAAYGYGTVSLPGDPEDIWEFTISSGARRVEVTLIYLDRPGNVNASIALVNDLDIRIVSPSGISYSNPNGFSTTDNVQKVIVDAGAGYLETGTWRMRITAFNIPGGGTQTYAWLRKVISERPSLSVDLPESVTVIPGENFPINIAPQVSGALVSGVYSVVSLLHSSISLVSGSDGYIYGDVYPGESEQSSPAFRTSATSTLEDAIRIEVGSSNGGTITRYVDVIIPSPTISGYVRTSGGAGISEVIMSGLPGDPITNSSGYYSTEVSYSWSGTVTPQRAGYTFTPSSRSYNNVTSNQSNQNYTGAPITPTISGYVRTSGGAGISGVVMSGLPGNPSSDASGYYSGTVSYDWSGIVTPEKECYTFNPPSRNYSNVTSDLTNQNYVGETLLPAAPSNCIASDNFCDSIVITWEDNSDNESQFIIYRNGSAIAGVGANVTRHTDAPRPGTYSYYVTARNTCGESPQSNTDNGTRLSLPSAAFTGTPTSGCAPLTVQFTDQSSGDPTDWEWNFGDENTSTDQNPEHIYNQPGTYTVTLTVSNECGENTATKPGFIEVLGPEISILPEKFYIELELPSQPDTTVYMTISNAGKCKLSFVITESETPPVVLTSFLGQKMNETSNDTKIQSTKTQDSSFSSKKVKTQGEYIRSLADIPWLSVNPSSGTVQQGDSVDIEVSFNAQGLNRGIYVGYLVIESNDPDESLVSVICSLKVDSMPGIKEVTVNLVPSTYIISQNYPNPVIDRTTIKYGLPKRSHIKIVLYDITGKMVATLLDTEKDAGYYKFVWDRLDKKGRRLSNGTYFYRLLAPDYSSTKKVILLK